MRLNKIYNVDALEGLKQLETESIDAIITDPPYQLGESGFMGKQWDRLPGVEVLKESLRVLKTGAWALWMMTPRQDSLLEFLSRLKEAGFNIAFSSIEWVYATGFPKGSKLALLARKKGSKEAKKLKGSYAGFQPKPARELIIVSQKPLAKQTYVEQALLHLQSPERNQLGGTWLEDGRIPYAGNGNAGAPRGSLSSSSESRWGYKKLVSIGSPKGRFPANILVSDGALGKASRYFDLDLWFESAIKRLPKEQQRLFPLLYVPKPSKAEREAGLESLPEGTHEHGNLGSSAGLERFSSKARNIHPTVKPIKLISYLIVLTTREGDVVLDPFIGSGTTAISAILLNRRFIGFEIEPEYYKIAVARVNYFMRARAGAP